MHNSKVLIHTFIKGNNSGSPQNLLFFTDLDQLHSSFKKDEIKDEFDHSFVYLKSNDEVYVLWKNKGGGIEFCGSGAYALSWYLLNQNPEVEEITIQSKHINLKAIQGKNNPHLFIPSNKPIFFKEVSEGKIFLNEESGIYLLEKNDLNFDELWVKEFLNKVKLKGIHGLCVFNWKQDKGQLRYFVPWHGRDEDYVTGSIHQYLTPLVYFLYGVKSQKWTQLSVLGEGVLNSQLISSDKIYLSGNCY